MADNPFFSRRPLRSPVFLVGTGGVVGCVSTSTMLLIKHLRVLSFNTAAGLVLASFFLIAYWRSAARAHEFTSALLAAKDSQGDQEKLWNELLAGFSDMIQRGLILTAAVATMLFVATMLLVAFVFAVVKL